MCRADELLSSFEDVMVKDGAKVKTLASMEECVMHVARFGYNTVIHNRQERDVQEHPLRIVSSYGVCT